VDFSERANELRDLQCRQRVVQYQKKKPITDLQDDWPEKSEDCAHMIGPESFTESERTAS
jgi:hypothetical protein